MNLIISVVFAYIFLGISQVRTVLCTPVKITFGTILTAFLFWFSDIVIVHLTTGINHQRGRDVAFALVDILSKWVAMTLIIWALMCTAGLLIDNLLITSVIIFVVTFISMPILGIVQHIISNVLVLILAIPADLLFPLKK